MSFVETQVFRRIGNAIQIVPNVADTVFTKGGEALSGVVAAPFAALTFGLSKNLNQKADKTRSFAHILPGLISHVATVINPKFGEKGNYVSSPAFSDHVRIYGIQESSGRHPLFKNYITFSSFFIGKLDQKITEYSQKTYTREEYGFGSFLQQELATRVLSVIFIPVAVVARVADFAIGFLILTSQVYYLGTDEHVNNRMMHHLNILAVVDDVLRGIRGIFNPSAVFTLDRWDVQKSSWKSTQPQFLAPINPNGGGDPV